MVLLAEWKFGIPQTWTSEEGLPLFKEKMAEFSPCWFLEQPTICKTRKAFCFRVLNISGHIWVNFVLTVEFAVCMEHLFLISQERNIKYFNTAAMLNGNNPLLPRTWIDC